MSVPFFLATKKAESRGGNTSVRRAREAPTEMGSAGVMPTEAAEEPTHRSQGIDEVNNKSIARRPTDSSANW